MAYIISSGMSNSGIILNNNSMTVFDGGIVDQTTINTSANLYVSSGGTANNTIINDAGWTNGLYIYPGGVANNAIVNNIGAIYIHSGATATEIVENGGYVECRDDANYTFASHTISNLVLNRNSATVHSGTTANSTVITGDGSGNFAAYNSRYAGRLFVFSGGTANNTFVNFFGDLIVRSSGVANNTMVNGGSLTVLDCGTANSTTVNRYGYLYISSGGRADNISVISYGKLFVSSGGTATEIVENGGYVEFQKGASVTFVRNSFSGLILYNSSATVHSGTTANSVMLSGFSDGGARLFVYSGGIVNSAVVNYRGKMDVSSDGVASNLIVNTGGSMFISSGGELTGRMIFNSGAVVSALSGSIIDFDISNLTPGNSVLLTGADVIKGSYVFTLTVSDTQEYGTYFLRERLVSGTGNQQTGRPFEGTISVRNTQGEIIDQLSVGHDVKVGEKYYHLDSFDGTLSVVCGNSTGNDLIVISRASMEVSSGVIVTHTVVSMGSVFVSSGGTANSTMLKGGSLSLFDGGAANDTVISSGSMIFSSGGTANDTVISGGSMIFSSGGTANDTVISGGNMIFSSGGAANNTTVNSGGIITVKSGGTANNTMVSGGRLIVSSGGTANNTTVNEGYMFVSIFGGGIASNITNLNGKINVADGGKLTGRVVCLNSKINMSSTAILDFDLTQILPGAAARVNDFSRISGTPVYTLTVNADQEEGTYSLAESVSGFDQTITVVNTAGEELGILSVDETVTISDASYLLHLSGNTLSLTIGNADLPSQNEPDNSVVSGIDWIVSSGTSISGTIISSGDKLTVSEGGIADNTTVNPGGIMMVSSGGTATEIVENGGYVGTEDGARVTFVSNTISVLDLSNTSATIHSGTTANQALINPGGRMDVYSGGTATEIVENGGFVGMEDGASVTFVSNTISGLVLSNTSASIHFRTTANSTTVNSRGRLSVYARGTANSTIVNEGGNLTVNSGGTATEIVENGGFVSIANNAIVTFVSNTISGLVLFRTSATVHSGTTATNTLINMGQLHVSSGGTANSTTVNSYGHLYVASSGFADYTTINQGVELSIGNKAVANHTTVNPGALFTVNPSGTALEIEENGGYVNVSNGASVTFASHTIHELNLSPGASATVHSGTTANSVTVNSGGRIDVFSGGIANNISLNPLSSYGPARLYLSGGTATTVIVSSGCSVLLSDSGIVNNAMVYLNGGIEVSSGCIASNTTISGGYLHVLSGGTADGILYNYSANYFAYATGSNSSGGLLVDRGAVVNNVLVNGYNSNAVELIGATANGIILNNPSGNWGSGLKLIAKDAVINDAEINLGCVFELSSNAVANNTTINCGTAIISAGGVMKGVVQSGGGLIQVRGGTVNDVIGGSIEVYSGVVSNVVARGYLTISGGTVTEIVEDGGFVNIKGGNKDCSFVSNTFSNKQLFGESASVHSGTTANSTMLYDSGYLLIDGGVANHTIVNSGRASGYYSCGVDVANGFLNYTTLNSGGRLCLWGGGVVNSITVKSGGTLCFSSGGRLTGQMTFESGMRVSASGENHILDFDISELAPGAGARVNDLSCLKDIQKALSYTLTVSDEQAKGTYALSEGAAGFNGTLTVQNNLGESFGTLSVENPLVTAKALYTLTLEPELEPESQQEPEIQEKEATILTLTISANELPTVSNIQASVTIPTNQDIVLTADFADDIELAQSLYRLGEAGEWTAYVDGVTVTENCTVYFKAVDATGNESEIASYTVANIDKVAPSDPAGVRAFVEGQDVALLWNGSTDEHSGVKEYVVTYSINGQELTVRTSNTNYVLNNADFGSYSWSVQAVDFAGNKSAATTGDVFVVSGFKPYTVEYSADNFEHVITFAVTTPSLDAFRMPTGIYQIRVKQEGSSEWLTGDPIVAPETDIEPQLIKSDADGNADVFFANSIGTWESGYLAQHVGSINDWAGTNEYAAVFGKNKLADIIEGSTDANILLMTDDENGDALFVDDIYTALPGSVSEQQSRIAQIDEIRAGFGNDIVDMTSQRFEYIGDGLTIRGGAGNDTIWANKGDNRLFGDAGNDRIVGASGDDVIAGGIGNDRMHGGGGDDVFTFCDNWGVDNVEQLETGTVTLWFASGDESNWNAETLTYTDGDNSVTVKGVTVEQVTLKFGDDGSDQFAMLSGMGAFFDATTERIFEESGKGILASL